MHRLYALNSPWIWFLASPCLSRDHAFAFANSVKSLHRVTRPESDATHGGRLCDGTRYSDNNELTKTSWGDRLAAGAADLC